VWLPRSRQRDGKAGAAHAGGGAARSRRISFCKKLHGQIRKSLRQARSFILMNCQLTYLQHLHLLQKLQAADFIGIILRAGNRRVIISSDMRSLCGSGHQRHEDIRRALSEGIESGKSSLTAAAKNDDKQFQRIQNHPTLELIGAAALADAIVIDDRYFNQLRNVQDPFAPRPIWDHLRSAHGYKVRPIAATGIPDGYAPGWSWLYPNNRPRTYGVTRANFSFRWTIGGERRAEGDPREPSCGAHVQWSPNCPKKACGWTISCAHLPMAIKSQWNAEMDDQVARARSDWLLKQLDVRQWSHRYKIEGHPEVAEIRFRGPNIVTGLC